VNVFEWPVYSQWKQIVVSEKLKKVSDPLNFAPLTFNVLEDVIDTLRFRGSIFFHSSLAAPWGMSLSTQQAPRFHIALEGGFYIGAGESQFKVNAGEIVMIPDGNMHWIADQLETQLVPSEQAGEACSLGMPLFQQGHITNRVMCGIVEYNEAISHSITSALPPVFHLKDIKPDDSIWMTVKLIDAEMVNTNSKKSIVVDRLTEVLFIKLLTRYIDESQNLSGFFAALRNPRLNKILQLIHQNPEKSWSLETMGNLVGMSQATLKRKFKADLGVSPMTYVNHWRMAKACQSLLNTNFSLEKIAENIGFADARTFRNAFGRHYGISPSAWRKQHIEQTIERH
jgi:AraC-like DNA-binding protein